MEGVCSIGCFVGIGFGIRSIEIEGARCSGAGAFHDMEINHGCFDAGMSHQRLDGTDVGSRFQ